MRALLRWCWRRLGFVSAEEATRLEEEAARLRREIDALASALAAVDVDLEAHEPEVRVHRGPPPESWGDH